MGSSCSAGQTQHAAEETKAAELCWWGGIDAIIRSSWGQQSIAAARDHERRATHPARVGECGGTSSARWRSGCLRFGWPRCCGEHEGGQQQAAPAGAPVFATQFETIQWAGRGSARWNWTQAERKIQIQMYNYQAVLAARTASTRAAFDDAGVKFVRNSNKIDARVMEGGSQKTQVRQLEALCTATAVLANTDMGVLEREAARRQMLFAVADGVDVDCSSDDEDGEVVGASNSDSGSDSESDVSSVGDDDDA